MWHFPSLKVWFYGLQFDIKNICFLTAPYYHWLNKNAVDRSYFEVSNNLTVLLTKCFCELPNKGQRKLTKQWSFLWLFCFLFFKGNEIESQRNMKNKLDFGAVCRLQTSTIIFTTSTLGTKEGIKYSISIIWNQKVYMKNKT